MKYIEAGQYSGWVSEEMYDELMQGRANRIQEVLEKYKNKIDVLERDYNLRKERKKSRKFQR